jgi:hypothetical protein
MLYYIKEKNGGKGLSGTLMSQSRNGKLDIYVPLTGRRGRSGTKMSQALR